jgi:hypothetical protein
MASSPPSAVPTATSNAASMGGRSVPRDAGRDIQAEAARLQVRVRREMAYSEPQRNPFRFDLASAPVAPEVSLEEPLPEVGPISAPAPRPFVTLAGIAADSLPQGGERTAVLSSQTGVMLVRQGDEVLGQYRVAAVGDDFVDLVSLIDGLTVRLSLAAAGVR